jgi:hypothetical protein
MSYQALCEISMLLTACMAFMPSLKAHRSIIQSSMGSKGKESKAGDGAYGGLLLRGLGHATW